MFPLFNSEMRARMYKTLALRNRSKARYTTGNIGLCFYLSVETPALLPGIRRSKGRYHLV